MAELIDATDEHINRFYNQELESKGEKYIKAYIRNGVVLGLGGIVQDEKGQWYGFIHNPRAIRRAYFYRVAIKMAMLAKLKGAKSLKTTCQHDIPRAEEFLKRLGFIETTDKHDERVIWEWVF